MKKLLLGTSVFAGLSLVAAAQAADLPAKAPRAAPPVFYNWSGFYIGGHVGGAWADINWDDVSLTGEPVSHSPSSWIAGGHVGFNYQVGSIVFGVEGTFSGTDLSETVTSAVNPNVTYTSDIDWITTVAGRLGVAWDRALIYAKGGGAWAKVGTSGFNSGIPDAFSISSTRSGWVVGVGLEYLVTPNFIFGVEYNHIDLGSHDRSGTTTIGLPFTITNVDTTIDSVVARLSYKFGGPFGGRY